MIRTKKNEMIKILRQVQKIQIKNSKKPFNIWVTCNTYLTFSFDCTIFVGYTNEEDIQKSFHFSQYKTLEQNYELLDSVKKHIEDNRNKA